MDTGDAVSYARQQIETARHAEEAT
jgi:hypothetical protein